MCWWDWKEGCGAGVERGIRPLPTVVGYGGTAPALAPVHLYNWCPRQPIV